MSNAASSSRLLAGLVFIVIGSAVLAHEAAPQAMSIDDLKRSYVSCSDAAMKSRLDSGGTMYCSVLYEELKRRAFGGDFDRLLAWSRSTDGGYFDPASRPRALPRETISRH
jgi:hypothetical protein